MSQVKEGIIRELDKIPPGASEEVLNFIIFLKYKRQKAVPATALASEPILQKDWLLPEEDEAWGDVVIVSFPFSDLSTVKRRPAFVIATPGGDDIILCQITSQQVRDRYAISITDPDFAEGTLRKPSNVRPNRLFSASSDLVLYRAGRLND